MVDGEEILVVAPPQLGLQLKPDPLGCTTTAMTTDRRPASAVLLTLCVWGLGQLYAGRPRAALAVVVGAHLYLAAIVVLELAYLSGAFLLAAVLMALAFGLAISVHAGIAAARAPRPYALQWYNRWWVYLASALFVWLVWEPSLRGFVRRHIVEAYRIPSTAMEPSILVGDFLFADKRSGARQMPHRNDVIIFTSLREPAVAVIKRVVGLPGDTLATRRGELYRNGTPVHEPWINPLSPQDTMPLLEDSASAAAAGHPTAWNWGPIVVPSNSLFVMGDNRSESYDSRHWGPLPADRVLARPLSLYFSLDHEHWHVRWERIGKAPWVVQPN